jgi:hypothetical protein
MQFTIDEVSPLLSTLREVKILSTGPYAGELRRLKENAGIRMRYFSRSGLSIDAIGEVLYSRGYLTERPTEREVLDLLDELFSTVTGPVRTAEEIDGAELENAFNKARRNRWRRWTCPSLCSSVRAGSLDLRIRCESCGDLLTRCDPTASEVTLSTTVAAVGF